MALRSSNTAARGRVKNRATPQRSGLSRRPSRSLPCLVGSVASAHLLTTLIDALQLFHCQGGDIGAGDLVVFACEFVQVDPGLVYVSSAVRDDAGLQQSLDEDTKDIDVYSVWEKLDFIALSTLCSPLQNHLSTTSPFASR